MPLITLFLLLSATAAWMHKTDEKKLALKHQIESTKQELLHSKMQNQLMSAEKYEVHLNKCADSKSIEDCICIENSWNPESLVQKKVCNLRKTLLDLESSWVYLPDQESSQEEINLYRNRINMLTSIKSYIAAQLSRHPAFVYNLKQAEYLKKKVQEYKELEESD